MKNLVLTIALVFGFVSSSAMAAEKADFNLETTEDLLDLCMVQQGQPFSVEAIHFCEGFLSGAVRYHNAVVGKEMKPILCYPEGTTRNDAIQLLNEWGVANRGNAELMKDLAVYGLIRALQSKWSCDPE